jgi:hypothetical protein
MERLYHAPAASSTPYLASLRYPHPARLSLMNESFRDRKNAFSYTIKINANFLSKCHGRKPVGIYLALTLVTAKRVTWRLVTRVWG